MRTGIERFAEDFQSKLLKIHFDERYDPYPKQRAFHSSLAPFNFLGGAAGPGKTACGLVEHMVATAEFNMDDAPHVHTLMVRRTQPKLEATLITRFRELIPKELYAKFSHPNGRATVTWLNGATTVFGSMQYEHNAWDYQGQWLKIFYDELCEFTFTQWNATSAWNRCPVSQYPTKDGAGNPIGIGAPWVRRLFVEHRPCDEMDDDQRKAYKAADYAYFPCTYLDNPIYANDPRFLANLNSYPKAIRDALLNGSWDIVGGYFYGAWDDAENTCPQEECQPQSWHKRWISGDWGFEHWAALYWHYMDDFGVVRTYKERLVKHHDPEMLAELVIKESMETGDRGNEVMPKFQSFPFSHDAFADQTTKSYGANPNSVAMRMSRVMRPFALPLPMNSGRDKIGREQTMYNVLRRRVPCGKTADGVPILRANWIISDECPRLIECIKSAPRDEVHQEQIAEFLGDDPLQGAGYGIYHIVGGPAKKPREQLVREEIEAAPDERSRHWIRLRETERRNAALRPKQYWET
jgi:hypothetical protein